MKRVMIELDVDEYQEFEYDIKKLPLVEIRFQCDRTIIVFGDAGGVVELLDMLKTIKHRH